MLNLMKRLVREEEGQGMVEYALIIGLVSVAALLTLGLLGGQVQTIFTKITDALSAFTPAS